MTDTAKKTSELPTANTIGNSDRLVFLYQANSSTPSARTITVKNLTTNLVSGPYANDDAANTNNVPLKGLYYDDTGTVKIRLT
jgi:hypothetical protein